MTAGHDGTPENDDPFGYLYRSEDGLEQPEPDALQPGMPRTSHHQVQRVGERRPSQPGAYGYPQGQPAQQPGGYGYPQQGQQQYGAPTQQYGAAPTQQYGAPPPPAYDPPPSGGHRGHQGGGPAGQNRKGLLIGAVAVVVVVAIAIAFAMTNSSGDKKKQADAKATTAPAASAPASTAPTPSATPTDFASPKVDASTLVLSGGAAQSNQWPGAGAAQGTYVDHMGTPGASVAWTVTVPKDGPYTFFISYGNAGQDANLTLGINGTPRSDAVNLKNYGGYTEWDKAWNNHTFSWVDLKKGANVISLTCAPNTNCGVNLDQVWLKQGQVKN
jgi:hypothetical protein